MAMVVKWDLQNAKIASMVIALLGKIEVACSFQTLARRILSQMIFSALQQEKAEMNGKLKINQKIRVANNRPQIKENYLGGNYYGGSTDQKGLECG